MRPSKAAFLLLLLAALAAPAARAQTTTSSIRGVVVDSAGPIAGATVEAVSTTSGFRRTATSGDDGSFSLPGLDPGVYTLTVSSGAYSPQSRTVQILIGQDVEVSFVLSPSEMFTEDVTVVGESVQLLLETRNHEISTNITPRQIESLPQNNRNFLSFAQLAPGVRFNDDQDAAGQKFRSGGSDARQVNVFIDGLSFKNDILPGGGFMQESSRGNPFPQNAVQEFRVLTQNFKAEYEKASAAVITAVTKSGGNEVHGDVFYLTQDKDFVAQDDFSRERGDAKPDYEREQIGLSVGGPIVRDKLHYFLSYEGQEQDRNATVFLGGSYNSAPANVKQFIDQFETGVLTTPFESDLYFGKLSWQPATSQTLHTSFHLRDEQEVRGFGGQRTRDGAESFEIGTDAFVAKHSWILGNFLNEAAATYQTQQWQPTALDDSTPRLNYIGILDVGGKDATQDFEQDRIGIRDDVSWMMDWRGGHNIKGGVSVNWLDYSVSKQTFENGLFEFRSDENWQFPFQARVGFGDPELAFSNTQAGL
ncbi:MAG TPA: carboxypeptidase-like regulatory domain-containing protein, partial [Thermoanaerobaculia bacterium]|nr:carboxypeptidase-like regulatory domain-containing protein [Thermoanaerobaculia bacterium]